MRDYKDVKNGVPTKIQNIFSSPIYIQFTVDAHTFTLDSFFRIIFSPPQILKFYTMVATANGSGKPYKFLIYGRTGWIGGLLGKLCEAQKIEYVYGSGRLENRPSLESDIASVQPTHVFNAAGVTGRPNVDWCESHKVETIRTNVVGTLTLADVCREKGLVLINYATGCIFEYDDSHPLGSGIGFKEEDTPNFIGSFYSKTKAMVGNVRIYRYCVLCIYGKHVSDLYVIILDLEFGFSFIY